MMKKYRVNEVAKDLNVENKDVIEALKPFSDEPKKYMTALTEEDLDVVFDTFTKRKQCRIFLTHILLKGRMLSQLPLLKKHRNQKKTQLLKCKRKSCC